MAEALTTSNLPGESVSRARCRFPETLQSPGEGQPREAEPPRMKILVTPRGFTREKDWNSMGPRKCGPVLKADGGRGQFFVESRNVPQWNPERGLWEWWYYAAYRVAPYGPRQSTTWYQHHRATSPDGEHWEEALRELFQRV